MLNVDMFLLFEKGGVDEREPKNISLITILFCFFNEFAFTVNHKMNRTGLDSTQILGFVLICLYFNCDWPFPRVYLILDSVFSDCVVF